MSAWVYMHAHNRRGRQRSVSAVFLSCFSALLFETESLVAPEAYQFTWTSWPATSGICLGLALQGWPYTLALQHLAFGWVVGI